MVSQADVARAGKEKTTGEVVEAISRPPHGPRVAGAEPEAGSGRETGGTPAPEGATSDPASDAGSQRQ
jgi:hypothetical protein